MSIDLVIAYYKEDLYWFDDYKSIPFRNIYIYNKGPNEPKLSIPFIEKKLDNIGRCDHTYLYHIIENYNNLADITIFTTGSASLSNKEIQLHYTILNTLRVKDSVFVVSYYNNVAKDNYDFSLDYWESTDEKNKEGLEASKLHKADIRPFGKWYDSMFPNIHINHVTYLGIFSVSKIHIQQHDIEYYRRLIQQFPNHSNPEVGHYIERSWIAIFNPIPETCFYYL